MTGPCLCGDPYCRRCFPGRTFIEDEDREDFSEPPDEPVEQDDEDEDTEHAERERAEDACDRRSDDL